MSVQNVPRSHQMGHESPAAGTVVNKIVRDEVWLETADAISFYAVDTIEGLDEVEERFTGVFPEISDIHPCEHYFLSTFCGSIFCLFDE